MNIPIVILAGKPPQRDALMEYANVDNKVFIEYKGKMLVNIVIDAVLPIASYVLIIGTDSSQLTIPDTGVPVEFVPMEGE